MSRNAAVLALLALTAFPAPALATGGTAADPEPASAGAGVVTASHSGGTSADEAGAVDTTQPSRAGATTFSRNAARPVARVFSVAPTRLREDRVPAIRMRIDQPGSRTVNARVVIVPVGTNRAAVSIDMGRVRTGRTVRVSGWPRGKRLAPGTYDVRVHARDNAGATLARVGRATGKVRLTVVAKPAPAPAPTPSPAPAPSGSGVFPVRGAFTFGNEGSRFGAGRVGHTHEGQDMMAAEGTPVVSPLTGTVAFVQYQPGGAGWYIVLDADDGRSLFFAHLKTGSISVTAGQRVSAGTQIAQVGSTGSSTGPHLHFEIWEGGWRNKGGRPVDPLAQLRAWQ